MRSFVDDFETPLPPLPCVSHLGHDYLLGLEDERPDGRDQQPQAGEYQAYKGGHLASSHSLGDLKNQEYLLRDSPTEHPKSQPLLLLIFGICFVLPNFCIISPLSPLMDWMLLFLICSPLRSLRYLGFMEY